MFEYHVEQRKEIGRFVVEFALGDTLLANRVDDREFRLKIARTELKEEFQYLLFGALWICRRFVDLVDDHNRTEPEFE